MVTPIPARRKIRHKIEVLRLGEWVDLSAFLARAEYNLGDHTAVGTDPGGTDGVARTASITLKNSGEMKHYWQSTLTRHSDDVLSDSEFTVGWSDESADKILEWLFGPAAGWTRQNLSPRDQTSPINLVEIDGVMQYVPLLWPGREIRGWGRVLADLEFKNEAFVGDGATDTYTLAQTPVEPETMHVEASGGPIDWEIDGWTGTLWLSRPLAANETLNVEYSYYTQDTGWVCEFHGVLGGNIAMDGHAVNLEVVDLSKRLQDRFIEDAADPYSGPMEQVMQDILDDHFGAGTVKLFFPSGTNADPLPPSESPKWMVTEYVPEHVSVFDALGRLASRRGWFVGYRWHAPTQQMQLQLMSPPRDKNATTADVRLSWLTDFYTHELAINDMAIRNRITVEYRDGNGELQSVTVQNQGSIDEYGLRAMFIGEDETSEIRDHEAALRLANAALSDLSDMTGTSALDMPVLPGFDVFKGVALDDPRISSTEDFLGVENVTQVYDFEGGRFRTQVSGTNRVIGGRRRWLRMEPRPGAKPPVPPESVGGGTIVIPAPVGVQWESIPGGITVTVPKPPVHALRWSVTEVHISDTDGFTPDDTTLAAANRATEFPISPLVGGETVYVRAAYVDVDGKRYTFSDQVTGETGEIDPVDTTPPDPPTGLVAIPVLRGFVLTWDRHQPPPPLDRYVLQVSSRPEGGSWSAWSTVSDEIRSNYCSHEGLDPDREYRYRLRAISRAQVESDWSATLVAGNPGKVSLAEDVVGRLARGDLAEDVIAELDGIVTIESNLQALSDDVDELSGDVSAVVQTADELSQTVAQVEDGLTTAQSDIQQNADQIALRLTAVDENGDPIPAAQIVASQVGGQGQLLFKAPLILMEGSVGVRELSTLGGGTQVTDDGVKIIEGSAEVLRLGQVGGLPWGPDNAPLPARPGLWGDHNAGLYLRGYAALIDAGYAYDEGDVRIPATAVNPQIFVSAKEQLAYSPTHGVLTHQFVDAFLEEDDEGKFYRIKAKTMIRGQEYSWPSRANARGTWTYMQPTTAHANGNKGVFTDFVICRPSWWINWAGFGGYPISLRLEATNEFDANGDPINWKTLRTWGRAQPGEGTLNWDTSLESYGQWAIRVRGESANPGAVTYATCGISKAGYRTGDEYLDVDGNKIIGTDPSSVSSRMSVLYMLLDKG